MAEIIEATGVTVEAASCRADAVGRGGGAIEQITVGDEGPDTIEEAGAAFIAAERPTSLLGRLADPAEVANMVVYVASPLASATSAVQVEVDGGVVRAIP